MASLFLKLRATMEDLFQLGKNGPQFKNNSDVIELRNADDSGYAVGRCSAPVADYDIVNKYYADSLSKPIIISRQEDCSGSLPTNTASRGFVMPTTVGSGVSYGDILYDDGSSSGNMTILAASEGRNVVITDLLTGGTYTYQPDTVYVWDADGSTWIACGGAGTGAVKEIEVTIGTSASYTSVEKIPASCKIIGSDVVIGTPYSASATITVGSESTATLYQATTDNDPQTAGQYSRIDRVTGESSAESVVVAITNTPAAGAGSVVVRYSKPLA